MRVLPLVCVAALLSACPVPPSAAARAQEAAQDLNIDSRFGRNETAIELVAPKARDEFVKHRRGWGTSIRIADVEIAGMHLKDDAAAEVTVKVAWYRAAEEELRVTSVRQKWENLKGSGWVLASEERIDGDVGLLGEPLPPEPPAEPHENAHFPTIRLGN
jgi:hypothetical protein